MKKVVLLLSLCFANVLCGCYNYHKFDFYASNQGFSYLDSLDKSGRKVLLTYPRDVFMVAKPYLLNYFGSRSFRRYKPFHIFLVNDSTWEVWTDANFYGRLREESKSVGWMGIGISIYDGKIKYKKENR